MNNKMDRREFVKLAGSAGAMRPGGWRGRWHSTKRPPGQMPLKRTSFFRFLMDSIRQRHLRGCPSHAWNV
jgi:hypothetical protein